MNRLVKIVRNTDWGIVTLISYENGLIVSPVVGGIAGAYYADEDDMGECAFGGMVLGGLAGLFSPVVLVGFTCNWIGKGLRKLKNK